MERMSDKQLEQRIENFMKRKAEQFPMLAEEANGARGDSLSLLSRISASTHIPHLHRSRHMTMG